jgi:hypothetical protein
MNSGEVDRPVVMKVQTRHARQWLVLRWVDLQARGKSQFEEMYRGWWVFEKIFGRTKRT